MKMMVPLYYYHCIHVYIEYWCYNIFVLILIDLFRFKRLFILSYHYTQISSNLVSIYCKGPLFPTYGGMKSRN